jgi:hypothetical protein
MIKIPIISEFDGGGISKAVEQFKQLEGAGAKAQFAIKKAAVPAAAALSGVAVALGDAVQGAMEDAAAQARLVQTIKNNTDARTWDIKSVETWISKTSQSAAVADDELRPALGKLITQTKDVSKAQEIMAVALDVSAATGKDLSTVTDAFSKAAGGNVKALAKLSPELKGMIKDGMDLDGAMINLQATFGGSSEVMANTAEGGMKKFSIAMSEAKENIGAALLPAIQALMGPLNALGQWAQDHTTVFLVIAGVIGGIAAAVLAVNTAMKIWEAGTKIWTALQWAWNAAMTANPIGLIVVGIAALVAGLVLAYKHFEGFRNVVDAVGTAIKTGFLIAISIVKTEVDALYAVFKFLFNGIATMWNNTVGKLHFSIPSWVPLIGGKGFDVPDIPMLADGGIVTGPTLAMIGERGPEAVIPLSKAGGSIGGGGVTIHVNGGDPQAVVDALRRFYRQNGPLPIGVAY